MKKSWCVALGVILGVVVAVGLAALGVYIFSLVKDLTFLDAIKTVFGAVKK